jgi:hypothetical protein
MKEAKLNNFIYYIQTHLQKVEISWMVSELILIRKL